MKFTHLFIAIVIVILLLEFDSKPTENMTSVKTSGSCKHFIPNSNICRDVVKKLVSQGKIKVKEDNVIKSIDDSSKPIGCFVEDKEIYFNSDGKKTCSNKQKCICVGCKLPVKPAEKGWEWYCGGNFALIREKN